MQEPTVLLDRVVEGCLMIYWLVPVQVVNHIILSLEDQIHLLPNSLYFDVEGHMIKLASERDSLQDTVEGSPLRRYSIQ